MEADTPPKIYPGAYLWTFNINITYQYGLKKIKTTSKIRFLMTGARGKKPMPAHCTPARMKEPQKAPWWYSEMNTLYLLVHHCWQEVWKEKKQPRVYCYDFKELSHRVISAESCTVTTTPGCRDSVVNCQFRGCTAACHLMLVLINKYCYGKEWLYFLSENSPNPPKNMYPNWV